MVFKEIDGYLHSTGSTKALPGTAKRNYQHYFPSIWWHIYRLYFWSRWLFKKILEFANTKVIALDRDIESETKANLLKNKFEDRFLFKNIKFSQLNNLKLKNENVKGVIFDLGYSYTQIKDPKKGLSFQSEGNLNMQMGLNNYSAEDTINKLDEKELEKVFKFFGEEKESKFIARNIVKERSKKKIDTQTLVFFLNNHLDQKYSL